jgi:hypothetical protein
MAVLKVQQNSFNPTCSDLEILITLSLRWVVPRPEVLLSAREKLYQQNRQISGMCSKRPPRVSVHQLLWHLLTSNVLLHEVLQLWRPSKHRREPWWPWTGRLRRYPNGILVWVVVQPRYRNCNRKLPVRPPGNAEYFIIWHSSSSIWLGLVAFCCISILIVQML